MKQLNLLILIACTILCCLSVRRAEAQQISIEQYLQTCPLLSEAQQKELIASVSAQSPQLEGETIPIYTVRTSILSRMDIRLYPMLNGTPLIGVIESFTAPIDDTNLTFYTPDWQPLELDELIKLPSRTDFLSSIADETSSEAERLRQLLYPLHYHIHWEEDGSLSIGAAYPLSQEDKNNEALQMLINKLPRYVYDWRSYRFEPRN